MFHAVDLKIMLSGQAITISFLEEAKGVFIWEVWPGSNSSSLTRVGKEMCLYEKGWSRDEQENGRKRNMFEKLCLFKKMQRFYESIDRQKLMILQPSQPSFSLNMRFGLYIFFIFVIITSPLILMHYSRVKFAWLKRRIGTFYFHPGWLTSTVYMRNDPPFDPARWVDSPSCWWVDPPRWVESLTRVHINAMSVNTWISIWGGSISTRLLTRVKSYPGQTIHINSPLVPSE